MPNFKNQKTSTNGGSRMSSTAVFKCRFAETPILDVLEHEIMNRIAESAFV